MSRREGDAPYQMEFSALEREALDEMSQRSGDTIPNVIRTALWQYSEHLEMRIDLRLGVFDIRVGQGLHPNSGRYDRKKMKPRVTNDPIGLGVRVAEADPHPPADPPAPASPAAAPTVAQLLSQRRPTGR